MKSPNISMRSKEVATAIDWGICMNVMINTDQLYSGFWDTTFSDNPI
jgi:hypothetical protein